METISFRPGHGFLSSVSPTSPWRVIFEDEGPAGYFYACEGHGSGEAGVPEASILDAMLIYNVGTLEDAERERLLAVEWSKDGLRAVLYLDGTAQAIADFGARRGYCRTNFPNFLEERGSQWTRTTHVWSDGALEEFEAGLYA